MVPRRSGSRLALKRAPTVMTPAPTDLVHAFRRLTHALKPARPLAAGLAAALAGAMGGQAASAAPFDLSGACCLPGGTCSILDSSSCTASAGIYQGDGSTCGAARTSPVLGATPIEDISTAGDAASSPSAMTATAQTSPFRSHFDSSALPSPNSRSTPTAGSRST